MVPLLGVTCSYITIINNYLQKEVAYRIFGLKVLTKIGAIGQNFLINLTQACLILFSLSEKIQKKIPCRTLSFPGQKKLLVAGGAL